MGYLLFHANRVSDKKPFKTFYANKKKVIEKLGSYTNEWQAQWIPPKVCFTCDGKGEYPAHDWYNNMKINDECERCDGTGAWKEGMHHILDIHQLASYRFHQPREGSRKTCFVAYKTMCIDKLPKLNDDLPPIVGYFQKKESGRKELICMYIFQWICEPKLVQYLIDWLNSTMMQTHHYYRQKQFNRNSGQIMIDVSLDDDDLPF
jgi:hypothetical protein